MQNVSLNLYVHYEFPKVKHFLKYIFLFIVMNHRLQKYNFIFKIGVIYLQHGSKPVLNHSFMIFKCPKVLAFSCD